MSYNPDLADHIRTILGPRLDLSEKSMFGGLAFLINGNLAIAASGQGGILVRIDPEITSEIINSSSAEIMVMRGKEMRGWVRVSDENLSDGDLSRWIQLSTTYTEKLPKKKK